MTSREKEDIRKNLEQFNIQTKIQQISTIIGCQNFIQESKDNLREKYERKKSNLMTITEIFLRTISLYKCIK